MLCKSNDIDIIKGHVSKDHIHLSVSKVVQKLKGTTSRKIMIEFKHISKQYWGRHFWARGYFVATSGSITDEMAMEYIENQDVPDNNDDGFAITN